MLAAEHVARLQSKLAALDHACQEAVEALHDLDSHASADAAPPGDADRWLPGIRGALERVQLECADLRYASRSLREATPSTSTLQPRLI
jgi:hypothetical protein